MILGKTSQAPLRMILSSGMQRDGGSQKKGGSLLWDYPQDYQAQEIIVADVFKSRESFI
jgi:hypothetical protein